MWTAPTRFLRPGIALPVFLVAKGVQCVVVGLSAQSVPVWGVTVMTMLVYGILVWFALKQQIISIWAVSIIMLYEGVGQVVSSLEGFGTAPAVHLPALILAVYVVLGGMVLFASRRRPGRTDG